MKTILTPQEVLNLAFAAGEHLPAEALCREQIVAAEERYVRPILGRGLYEKLLDGEYAELCAEYVRPLAAYATKRLVLPQLKIRIALCGVVEPRPEGWQSASEEALEAADRALRLQIESLSRRLHGQLETLHKAGSLPDYRPEESIRNRCCNHGGLIQIL